MKQPEVGFNCEPIYFRYDTDDTGTIGGKMKIRRSFELDRALGTERNRSCTEDIRLLSKRCDRQKSKYRGARQAHR
jgi:hypothetical protein